MFSLYATNVSLIQKVTMENSSKIHQYRVIDLITFNVHTVYMQSFINEYIGFVWIKMPLKCWCHVPHKKKSFFFNLIFFTSIKHIVFEVYCTHVQNSSSFIEIIFGNLCVTTRSATLKFKLNLNQTVKYYIIPPPYTLYIYFYKLILYLCIYVVCYSSL